MVHVGPLEITLLATGESVAFDHHGDGRLHLKNLPEEPPTPNVNTLRLRFPSKPERKVEEDHAAWLAGKPVA